MSRPEALADAAAHAADLLAVQDLVARYWAIVDGTLDAPVGPCFAEDGVLRIEAMEVRGRAALVEAVQARAARAAEQGRSTRHLASNALLRSRSGDEIVLQGLVTVFSGHGERPAPVPSSVGTFAYRCVREAGEWRIARLEGLIAFAGVDSPYALPAPSDPREQG